MPQLKENEHYTYADYCTWGNCGRWELISGAPFMMAPGPSPLHQNIAGQLYRKLSDFLDGKQCKVFCAPLDVRLNAENDDDTVVQPDLIIVCDQNKLDERGCNGTPDMVIEVLSPSSQQRDRFVKFQLYRQASVREYWIVDPDNKTIQAHILREGDYITYVYGNDDAVPVHIMDGFSIRLAEVFSR